MSTPRDRIEGKLGLAGPPLRHVRDAPPRVPDHELVRRIGQGSYGEVWLARNALGTWRAVKIVYRDNFKDARPYEREFAGIRRFEPLSRANEGLVDILQVGRDDADGWFYYVMELADDAASESEKVGKSERETRASSPAHFPPFSPANYLPRTLSRDRQQRGRLPLEDCLQLGLTLSLALGHLHRHGLIHRDVKPSNIIYVGGVPKLADIGLVTEAQGANTFVGTEGFVPPEGPTSPQADLYALGKVLYEAAMGKDRHEFPEPFTQIGTDRESVALMELNAVLLRACAPDLKKRYASAEEMHADLALLHSGGSVKRRHQFDRQFQIAKQIGAVAMAATLLVGSAWLWQQQQTRKMTRLAEEKSTLASEKTKLVDDLTKLGQENRNRIVRLDIANGIRLLDESDPAGALLWFADALPLLTNNPAQESIHRIRIQQTLDLTPRVLRIFADEAELTSCAASPDGRLMATGARDGTARVWNIVNGKILWGPKRAGPGTSFVRLSGDGKRLFVTSSPEQLMFNSFAHFVANFATVLDAETGAEVYSPAALFPKPAAELTWSAFSPDDRWLALAERSGAIRLIDLKTGQPVSELPGHESAPRFLSFDAGGSLLASAGSDKTARLWRVPSGEPVSEPLVHRGPVNRVLLSPSGRHLLTASFLDEVKNEAEFRVWEAATGKQVGEAIAARGYLAMFVAPGSEDRFFIQDDLHDKMEARLFSSPNETLFKIDIAGGIQCWSFSKEGDGVALGTTDGSACIFETRTWNPVSDLFRSTHWGATGVSLLPEQAGLLVALDDGSAYLWDLRSRAAETVRRNLPAPLQRLDQANGAFTIGSFGTPLFLSDGTLRLFGDNLEEQHRFTKPTPKVRFRDIKRAWSAALCVSWQFQPDDKSIYLWRATGSETVGKMLAHPASVGNCVEFTHDDQFLMTTCADGKLRKWHTADGTLEQTVSPPTGRDGRFVEISNDGETALWYEIDSAAGANVNRFQFFDLDSGQLIGEVRAFPMTVMFSLFSPDGRKLAVLDATGAVTIIESRSGRVISNRIRHSTNPIWVEWDPECRRLLTAGHNDEVLVWDVVVGTQLLGPLRLPGGPVRVATWSPDGRFIIARNDGRKVRVWDAATGEAMTPAIPHSGDVDFARMTRDRRLISLSYPDLLRAWDLTETGLPADVLADYARLLSGRQLNASGTMIPLRPEELAELSYSLHARAPKLFE